MNVVNGVTLTDTQKQVLCTVAGAASPDVAADQLSGNQNMVSSITQLTKLGLLTQSGSSLQVTDSGKQIMTNYQLIDPSGQLTDSGKQLSYSKEQPHDASINGSGQAPAGGMAMGGAPGGMGLDGMSAGDDAPIGGEPGVDQQDDQENPEDDQQDPDQQKQMTAGQGSFENYEMRPLKLLKELIKL